MVVSELGTTAMSIANSPDFSGLPLIVEVLPDTASTVQWAFLAVKTDPVRVTVVDVALEAPPVTGVVPDLTPLIV
jgi:hypothetical protein